MKIGRSLAIAFTVGTLAAASGCSARSFYAATYESLRHRESLADPVDPARAAASATSFAEYEGQRRIALERAGD